MCVMVRVSGSLSQPQYVKTMATDTCYVCFVQVCLQLTTPSIECRGVLERIPKASSNRGLSASRARSLFAAVGSMQYDNCDAGRPAANVCNEKGSETRLGQV